MKKIKILFMLCLLAAPLLQAADQPGIEFLSPKNNEIWLGMKEINIQVKGVDPGTIRVVELYLDGKLLKEFKRPPYSLRYDFGQRPKFRKLKAVLRNINQDTLSKEIRSDFFDDVQEVNIMQVVVPVAVMDQKGNYVSGLKKEDFILLEDGVAQDHHYADNSASDRMIGYGFGFFGGETNAEKGGLGNEGACRW